MDEIDRANEHAEEMLRRQIKMASAKPIPTSEVCLNCNEPTTGGARWCDAFCREDWEKQQRAEKQR